MAENNNILEYVFCVYSMVPNSWADGWHSSPGLYSQSVVVAEVVDGYDVEDERDDDDDGDWVSRALEYF